MNFIFKLRNPKLIFPIILFTILIVIVSISFGMLSKKKISINKIESQLKEFSTLTSDYLIINSVTDKFQKRLGMSNIDGVLQAVENVVQSIGLKEKLSSVKLSGQKKHTDFTEENAVIKMDKVSLNETINIFYKIENAPMGLLIKSCKMKKNFSDPDKFDITMDVAFLKKKKKS